MALLGGGGSAAMTRDVGTAGPVQGFQAKGSAIHGARLVSALATAVLQQAGAGSAQLTQVIISGTSHSIRISGIYKAASIFIRVGGIYKSGSMMPKVSGTYK